MVEIFPTHLKNLNDILLLGKANGFKTGEPYLFYGSAQQGKSLLLYEIAYYMAIQYSEKTKEQKNIVVVDTEGGADTMIQLWEDVWFNKFKPEKYVPKFEIVEAKTAEKVVQAHGINVVKEIKQSKAGSSGQTVLTIRGTCPNRVLDACKKVNAGVLVYDSLVSPLMPLIVGGMMNYPTRAGAEVLILEAIQSISDAIDPVILVTNHATKDPKNVWSHPDFVGGKNIHHGFKFILYVQQSKHSQTTNAREIVVGRYPNIKERSKTANLWLQDDGWRDISQEELTKLRSTKKGKTTEEPTEEVKEE